MTKELVAHGAREETKEEEVEEDRARQEEEEEEDDERVVEEERAAEEWRDLADMQKREEPEKREWMDGRRREVEKRMRR